MTGTPATDISTNVESIDQIQEALRGRAYIADRSLGTALFLALRLGKPLLLEGEAGVGKTEVAKTMATLLNTELIRLQCYEGLDVNHAVYEWNYAKQMLEIAVALLGVSVSFRTLAAVGPGLLCGIVGVVVVAIPTSFAICRLLGLPKRMAVLVACGNSICGNSAIAAVAPTIGADGDDVAASIAFTAVLGVLVVLFLTHGQ